MKLPPLRLNKDEDRRILAGHVWAYSNEVDNAQTPLKGFEAGQAVELQRHDGRPLGSAFVNPHSLICARLYARRPGVMLDATLLRTRIETALHLRSALFSHPSYRLVHSESDQLPGLIVDRFGDVLVAQINAAGMERVKDELLQALRDVLAPAAILLRNDTASRSLEGLPQYVETAWGTMPARALLRENGAEFEAPLLGGQKTGWFYDHRLSRERMTRYVAGKRVLDVFSYAGAWTVQAARAGARQVTAVDSSQPALELLAANAKRNGVADTVMVRQGDAFEVLKTLAAAGERFDVVIADPPAFIKRKKDIEEGSRAYFQLNRMAMDILAPAGLLISASCSHHFSRELLLRTLLRASRQLGRELQVIEQGHQGPDHPIHPAIPETEYLKTFFCRVL